nr:type II toxin-antitoxin system RelB/DinJ family antitoxin [uncultured Devosia sp.]
MAANALIQTRIDADIKDRATAVLDTMGLTVSDAVRILLTRVANEGALPAGLTTDPEAYDRWFRAKVQEALDDLHPGYSSAEVEAHFAEKRAATLRGFNEE